MKAIEFPLIKTKIENCDKKFNLTDLKERKEYFELKVRKEIEKLRNYLEHNTFICYLLGKKNSGKGTYAKMFREVVSKEKIDHLSIGDLVRSFDKILAEEKQKLEEILKRYYRGFISPQEILERLEKRDTKTLLPTELILALVKEEISKREKKAILIDGFPRNLDQISYSLFFRDLIGYRDDPDFFVIIDVPERVLDERIKYRVVCPKCQTSRNLKLLPTSKVEYDENEKKFYLLCDNPECNFVRMVSKEGDELGIEGIRERLNQEEQLMRKAFKLYGIPKILLRNSVPVEKAKEYYDDYEITPIFSYEYDQREKKVKIIKKPWEFLDDNNEKSYSLMPPPVVISLIKQLVTALSL